MITFAALAGLGVALLPTYLIEEELRANALAPVFNLWLTTDNSYYIVRPEAKRTQAAADLFEIWLLSQVTG